MRVGNLQLDVVSDGHFLMDVGGVFGLVPRALWEPLAGPPDAANRIKLFLNCLLIRGAGRTILVDTGIGGKIAPSLRERAYPGDYGHLLESLASLAVTPDDVDTVINTHLHFDHCGGNTIHRDGDVSPTFPRARYYIQRTEWDDATHPNERTRATYLGENIDPLATAGLVELVEGETRVTPEVVLLPAPGHTEGHAAVVVSSGGETALYLGDLVQHATQLERAAWISAYDVLPLVSLETKKRIVEEAIRSGSLVMSTHIPTPGRLLAGERGPRWSPEG